MVDLLNACLHDEMARDPRIVVFGQDVADCSREGSLDEVKGKGGVFKVTHNLQRRHGSHRVYNTPLAEANIVGRAIGMATRGLKPVVEIQFFDYIWPAYMQIRNELAVIRWRSNGVLQVPRGHPRHLRGLPPGRGGVPQPVRRGRVHPRAGAAGGDPLERPGRERPAANRDPLRRPRALPRAQAPLPADPQQGAYPGPDYTIPFGKAAVRREGRDVTVVTFGALVHRSLVAAKQLALEGVEAEVLDLRTLSPYDWDAVSASVRKTGRVVVAHEDSLSWGYGAEIAARVAGSSSSTSTPRSAAWARSTPSWATTRPWRTPSCPRSRRSPTPCGRRRATEPRGPPACDSAGRGGRGQRPPDHAPRSRRTSRATGTARRARARPGAHRAQRLLHARDGGGGHRERAEAEAHQQDRLERLARHLAADRERPAVGLAPPPRSGPACAAPRGAAARRARRRGGPSGPPRAGTG